MAEKTPFLLYPRPVREKKVSQRFVKFFDGALHTVYPKLWGFDNADSFIKVVRDAAKVADYAITFAKVDAHTVQLGPKGELV